MRNAFEHMGIADEELKAAFPDRRSEPRCLFKALCTPALLQGVAPIVYRAHVGELVQRARLSPWVRTVARACPSINERDEAQLLAQLDLPTDAEALMALSGISLKAPLARDFACAYRILFERAFGAEETRRVCGGDLRSPSYPGAAEECIAQVVQSIRGKTLRSRP